jgi:hypothetical protein
MKRQEIVTVGLWVMARKQDITDHNARRYYPNTEAAATVTAAESRRI